MITKEQEKQFQDEIGKQVIQQIQSLYFNKFKREIFKIERCTVSKLEKIEFESGYIVLPKESVCILFRVYYKIDDGMSSHDFYVFNNDKIIFNFNSDLKYEIVNLSNYRIN